MSRCTGSLEGQGCGQKVRAKSEPFPLGGSRATVTGRDRASELADEGDGGQRGKVGLLSSHRSKPDAMKERRRDHHRLMSGMA